MARIRLTEEQTRALPKYKALPAILLGRLAVDRVFKGQGYGQKLLMHALGKAANLSKEVAVNMVVVDAKDDNAISFYGKYGFISLADNRRTLFLPIKTIREALK